MAEVTSAPHRPWILGNKSLTQVSNDVFSAMESRPSAAWWAAFLVSFTVMVTGFAAIAYEIRTGIGTWGLNRTVGWAFDITNFVFWIGIGHAGTLISAILFLFRQKWRTSVNRSAEAMTIFAVMCAGLFPLIHMGRPWLAHWMFPYPNTRGSLWINFRSPLVWDFSTIRDRASLKGLRRTLTAIFALGWNGSYRAWQRYEIVYLLLAGLATPLVVSVHTIVSWDFATAVLPGWHATIFP